MLTPLQAVLLTILLTVTFLVTYAAVQIFFLLREFRITLKKFNRLLDSSQPSMDMSDFFSSVKDLVNQTEDRIISTSPDRVISPGRSKSSRQRFFHRLGTPMK